MTAPAPRRKFRIVKVDNEGDTGRTVLLNGNTLRSDEKLVCWDAPPEVTRDDDYADHSHDVTTCLVTFEIEVADPDSPSGWRYIKRFNCVHDELDIGFD